MGIHARFVMQAPCMLLDISSMCFVNERQGIISASAGSALVCRSRLSL